MEGQFTVYDQTESNIGYLRILKCKFFRQADRKHRNLFNRRIKLENIGEIGFMPRNRDYSFTDSLKSSLNLNIGSQTSFFKLTNNKLRYFSIQGQQRKKNYPQKYASMINQTQDFHINKKLREKSHINKNSCFKINSSQKQKKDLINNHISNK